KGHGGSRANLLGPKPTQELIDLLSNEKQVTKDTPPAYLVHSTGDKIVSWENSQMYADACKAHGVAAEFLKLTQGDHGLGCGKGEQWVQWQSACLEWMKGLNLIKR